MAARTTRPHVSTTLVGAYRPIEWLDKGARS